MNNLLEDISKSISQGAKDIAQGAGNLFGSIFPEENDDGKGNNVSSGLLEDLTEGLAKVVNLLDEGIKAGSKMLGVPSIGDMMDELQGEYEVADRVCDAIGGQSGQIPIPILPDASICISPKQVGWIFEPQNILKTLKAATVCALEKNVSDPIDFYLSLGNLASSDAEKMAGWGVGWLSGEGAPDALLPWILHPLSLHTPFAYVGCVQEQLAKEMGDMTQEDIDKWEADVKKFTGRDKGMAKGFINGIIGGASPLIKGIQDGVSDLAKNLGI